MSKTEHKFFENGFNMNKFTKRVNNLEWNQDDSIKVYGFDSSAVSRKEID